MVHVAKAALLSGKAIHSEHKQAQQTSHILKKTKFIECHRIRMNQAHYCARKVISYNIRNTLQIQIIQRASPAIAKGVGHAAAGPLLPKSDPIPASSWPRRGKPTLLRQDMVRLCETSVIICVCQLILDATFQFCFAGKVARGRTRRAYIPPHFHDCKWAQVASWSFIQDRTWALLRE